MLLGFKRATVYVNLCSKLALQSHKNAAERDFPLARGCQIQMEHLKSYKGK